MPAYYLTANGKRHASLEAAKAWISGAVDRLHRLLLRECDRLGVDRLECATLTPRRLSVLAVHVDGTRAGPWSVPVATYNPYTETWGKPPSRLRN